MDYKDTIDRFMSQGKGKTIDLIYELFTFILTLEPEQQPDAFQHMCETIKLANFNKENNIDVKEHFTTAIIDKYWPKLNGYIEKELNNLIQDSSKAGLTTEEFYKNIWLYILSSKCGKSKYEKVMAIFLLLSDTFIPYTSVGTGITMDDNTYSDIIKSFGEDLIRKTEVILKLDFDQKTQRASLLVDQFNELSSYEEQTVYMSVIIKTIEDYIKDEIIAKLEDI